MMKSYSYDADAEIHSGPEMLTLVKKSPCNPQNLPLTYLFSLGFMHTTLHDDGYRDMSWELNWACQFISPRSTPIKIPPCIPECYPSLPVSNGKLDTLNCYLSSSNCYELPRN